MNLTKFIPLGMAGLLTLSPISAEISCSEACCLAITGSEKGFVAGVDCGKTVSLKLPTGSVETFSLKVPYRGTELTVHFEKSAVVGKNTRFLVEDREGKLQEVEPSFAGAYLGRVAERADFSVGAILTQAGLVANIIRPGEQSITIEPVWEVGDGEEHRVFVGDGNDYRTCSYPECCGEPGKVVSSPAKSLIEYSASEGPVVTKSSKLAGGGNKASSSGATLPPTRVMDVLEYEVGVEIGSRSFEGAYGSNIASAEASAASIAANMDARYLRGAGIKHVLGTVIIRTNPDMDPLRSSVTGNNNGSLVAFRDYWNNNPGEVGTSHDLAVYHVRANPSGLAYVNSVGTSNRYALSCSNRATSWADGTLVHEFGHSWNLRHNNDAPIVVYDYEGGGPLPARFYESKPRSNDGSTAAGGDHEFVSVMNGSGTHNIGRLSTEEANTVYAIRQNKRNFGTVVANPGSIPPFGQTDRAFVSAGDSVTIDVIANDHDANNDVLDALLRDTVSHRGGTIALSVGTGPGGRNELIYTALENDPGGVDFFHYTVCDSDNRKDFGAVYVTVGGDLFFAESFIYPSGALGGNDNGGLTWANNAGADATTVTIGESLVIDSAEGLVHGGGKAVQASGSRVSLSLPIVAHGGNNGSVRYISFIQKLSAADAGKSQVIEFWNGGSSANDTVFSFGTDTNPAAPDYGLLIDKNGGNIALDLGSPDTDAHLVVLKVEYGAGNADSVSVFFDPGATEPAVADASSNFTDLAFNRVGFGSFQGGGQEIDEIRIGVSYESVVPLPVSEVYFEESFAYAAEDLVGKSNDGFTWNDEGGSGSTTVATDESIALSAPANFSNSGGRVIQTASDRLSLELVPEAAGGIDNTVRYISFVQKLGFADENKTQILEFWNGAAVNTNTSFSIGTDTNGAAPDFGVLLDKSGGDIAMDLGSASTDAKLIVLRVDYGPGGGDLMSAYVDPGATEPLVADAVAFYDDLAFTRIGIAAFQGGSQEVDEIRVGASYRDVVPLTAVAPDSDNDGLPDDFERTHYHPTDLTVTDGTDDLDNDGMNDRDEFVAGTDAANPNSVLRISNITRSSATEVILEWDSVSGIEYSIWSSGDLTAGSWTQVLAPKAASGPVTSETIVDPNPKKFFQVRVDL